MTTLHDRYSTMESLNLNLVMAESAFNNLDNLLEQVNAPFTADNCPTSDPATLAILNNEDFTYTTRNLVNVMVLRGTLQALGMGGCKGNTLEGLRLNRWETAIQIAYENDLISLDDDE